MESLSRREKEKINHEKEILNAAERLFCKNGYEAASMDEIAREAKFTKRTVYQYFEDKDDLYFAVILAAYRKLIQKIREGNKKEPTGYQKLERMGLTAVGFYRDHPDLTRLIASRNHILWNSKQDGKNRQKLLQFEVEAVREISDILEEGQGDGSILFGMDNEKTAASLMVLFTGFYQQFVLMNKGSEGIFSSPEELSLHLMELAVKPLKRARTATATRKGTA